MAEFREDLSNFIELFPWLFLCSVKKVWCLCSETSWLVVLSGSFLSFVSCLIPIFTPLWPLNPFSMPSGVHCQSSAKLPLSLTSYLNMNIFLLSVNLPLPWGCYFPMEFLSGGSSYWHGLSVLFALSYLRGLTGTLLLLQLWLLVITVSTQMILLVFWSLKWLPLLYCSCPLPQPFTFMAYHLPYVFKSSVHLH